MIATETWNLGVKNCESLPSMQLKIKTLFNLQSSNFYFVYAKSMFSMMRLMSDWQMNAFKGSPISKSLIV